jgi:hypothetical protein
MVTHSYNPSYSRNRDPRSPKPAQAKIKTKPKTLSEKHLQQEKGWGVA